MTRIPLILAFVTLMNLEVFCQEYFSFPTGNVNWNVYLLSTCENDSPPDTLLLRYTIHGDTSINEIVYSKLCLESGDTINPKIKSVGGIREYGKRIYFLGFDFLGMKHENEILLYDFNKQIGDTVEHCENFYSVIEEIDSIQIGENYRKRYKVDNHWFYQNPDYIVEGIGSIKNGLLGHITEIPTCGTHYWENICFKENGIVKYLNPEFNDCFPSNLLNSNNELEEFSVIKVFPNPFSEGINIENIPTNKNLEIKIFDINGSLILQKPLLNESEFIEIAKINGLLTIQIIDMNGKIYRKEKIVKL